MTSTLEARPAPCSSTFLWEMHWPFSVLHIERDGKHWQREAEDYRGPLSQVMEIDDCYSF